MLLLIQKQLQKLLRVEDGHKIHFLKRVHLLNMVELIQQQMMEQMLHLPLQLLHQITQHMQTNLTGLLIQQQEETSQFR